MATTTELNMNLFPGVAEYTGRFTPSTMNDDLQMEFNGEIVIQDIIVDLGGDASLQYDVNLIYPASGCSLQVASGKTTDYYLNRDESDYGRHLWYNLPSGTKLQVKSTWVTTADSIDVVVIGRSL